jgi:hypothetical protein
MSQTKPGIRATRSGSKPFPGMWDFDGAPGTRFDGLPWLTFTVVCFRWVAKSSGKGVKREVASKRFTGDASDPEATYTRAEAFCRNREEETGA